MNLPVPFTQTNVLKAVIVPYKDCKMLSPFAFLAVVLPVNPASYNESFKVNLDARVPAGSEHTDIKYKSTSPQKLKIDFYIDGTNTIEGYFNPGNLPVLAQIEKLKLAVYYINGDIHRSHFLKVFWGSMVFSGVLENMDIEYTLFNPLGIPIRAKISMTLIQHVDRELGLIKKILQSPDVTHVRNFKSGNRLDLMTNEIYNDSNLVLQVAKANKLTSFRNVKAGTEITLPPIDKQTS